MKILLPLSALAAAALLAGPPAFAQPHGSGEDSPVVDYSDLDLATPAGVAILDRRLRQAVQLACGAPSDADPEGKNMIRLCRARTMEAVAVQRERAIASARRSGETELAASRR